MLTMCRPKAHGLALYEYLGQAWSILICAHDTTTAALCSTVVALATHHAVEMRVLAEIDENRHQASTDLSSYPYTKVCTPLTHQCYSLHAELHTVLHITWCAHAPPCTCASCCSSLADAPMMW